jgi:hypothetical protein
MYERRTHEYDALISKRYASIGEAFLFSDLFVLARPAFLHFIFPIIRSDRDPSWPIQLISDKDWHRAMANRLQFAHKSYHRPVAIEGLVPTQTLPDETRIVHHRSWVPKNSRAGIDSGRIRCRQDGRRRVYHKALGWRFTGVIWYEPSGHCMIGGVWCYSVLLPWLQSSGS